MEEKYLFIIWNSALFCKNKIINDLKDFFIIEKQIYIKWSKENFADNLKAFYGTKMSNVDEKIKHIKNNEFLLIIIKDKNPIYEYRKTYNGQELVNAKLYDAKWRYRNWTGGQFRIHGTQTDKETIHDLTILFGHDYDKTISAYKNNCHIKLDTIKYKNFTNIDKYIKTLNSINNNTVFENSNTFYIFTECRKDIEFLHLNNKISICNKICCIKIFGELEGDIPKGFVNKLNNNIFNDFIRIENEYIYFLNNRNNISETVLCFLSKYNFENDFSKHETVRPNKKRALTHKVKDFIRYLICRIKYSE